MSVQLVLQQQQKQQQQRQQKQQQQRQQNSSSSCRIAAAAAVLQWSVAEYLRMLLHLPVPFLLSPSGVWTLRCLLRCLCCRGPTRRSIFCCCSRAAAAAASLAAPALRGSSACIRLSPLLSLSGLCWQLYVSPQQTKGQQQQRGQQQGVFKQTASAGTGQAAAANRWRHSSSSSSYGASSKERASAAVY